MKELTLEQVQYVNGGLNTSGYNENSVAVPIIVATIAGVSSIITAGIAAWAVTSTDVCITTTTHKKDKDGNKVTVEVKKCH